MKRKITLSIALVLSIVLVSLISSDSTAKAQRNRTYSADTGIVHLGANQLLRIMVAPAEGSVPRETISFTFDKIEYVQGTCSGGVCSHIISSQTTSDPITLIPGEAASTDIVRTPSTSGVRVIVKSNSQNMQVNALIIDTTTGATAGVTNFKVFVIGNGPAD